MITVSAQVYASPSRRKMDTKGDGEEMTYPHICFMVDNFDEVSFCLRSHLRKYYHCIKIALTWQHLSGLCNFYIILPIGIKGLKIPKGSAKICVKFIHIHNVEMFEREVAR